MTSTPFYNKWLNAYHAASAGCFLYASLALVIHVHNPPKWQRRDTIALFAGSPLVGVAMGLIKLRLMRVDESIGRRCGPWGLRRAGRAVKCPSLSDSRSD